MAKTTSKSAEAKTSNIKLPTADELLEAGVHFGHLTNKWNPKMQKFIFTERRGIHVIDLSYTLDLLEKALHFLARVAKNSEVIIVGTKRQARDIISEASDRVGMHSVINRWPGGLLTNFKVVSKSLKGLLDLEEDLASGVENRTKQEVVWMKRDQERMVRLYGGVKFMRNMPGAMIVIDAKAERNAIREARRIGIPVIALVDTNGDPDLVDYPIPANDDALKSLTLLVALFADTVAAASGPSESVVSLRKTHEAKLAKLEKEAFIKQELRSKEEEQNRERLKALREGKSVTVVDDESGAKVVRATQSKTEEAAPKDGPATPQTDVKKPKSKTSNEMGDLGTLGLSARTQNALEAEGVRTVDDLKKLSESDILAIKGLGKKAVQEISKAL